MPKHIGIKLKTIAISMLCEGNSIRGIELMTGLHSDTIMRLVVRVGNVMKKVQDELFTGIRCERLELDELWGFIGLRKLQWTATCLKVKAISER